MEEPEWEPDIPEPDEDVTVVVRRDRLLEIIVVLMLSLTSFLTAWSSYEAASWAGEQSQRYSEASARRLESSRAAANADQLMSIDINIFANYLAAYASQNTKLADFYEARFRPEFLPAFDAWLASSPLTKLDTAGTPFNLPEYQLASRTQANALEAEAEALFEEGIEAGLHSEGYILTVVVLALVLFLGGVSSRVTYGPARYSMIGMAGALLCFAVIRLITLPFA